MLKQLLTATLAVLATAAGAAELPADVKWVTNDTAPPIGSDKAVKGGTFNFWMESYPLTFRLFGPNSNDAFAGWNRIPSIGFGLVMQHPNTDEWLPMLATHWAVMDDNRTIYFKLDPDAKWSDGRTITADDYTFANEFLRSELIVEPFWNKRMEDYYETIEKIDDFTIRIVGKNPSWRPLYDYNIFPIPKHATRLTNKWVEETNLTFPVVPGPYVIKEAVSGQRVVFERIPNWWGENKRYFKGMWNVDRIVLKVIPDEDRAFDAFKSGDIDFYVVNTARRWAQEMTFDALTKGWAHRREEFVERPQGIYGIALNLDPQKAPLFQNADVRKAIAHAFDFDGINKNLMFEAYYRSNSVFEGTPFANPNVTARAFDPKKVREHLAAAGFTRRGPDGIWMNDKGQRLSFTLNFGSKGLERHMTTIAETMKKLGIEMKLQLLEPAASFERGLERNYEATVKSRTGGLYPEPHQYFHSSFKSSTQNNNTWYFGDPRVDELIDVYRFGMDEQKRLAAMHEIDQIVSDACFYIPFWSAPFIRFAYYDHIRFPETYFPRRTEQFQDYMVFWIDPAAEKELAAARKAGKPLPGADRPEDIQVDPWGVRAERQRKATAAAGQPAK